MSRSGGAPGGPAGRPLWALFLALLVPALAMYPSLLAFTTAAKERLIATQYAPLAARQRQDLQDALYATLDEIDAHPTLPDLVEPVEGRDGARRPIARFWCGRRRSCEPTG